MTSALDAPLGAHLLGRKPSPPDARDYQLAHFLTGDPLDALLASVLGSWEGKKTKALLQALVVRVKSLSPAPAPTPPPTPSIVSWRDADDPILDQGQTPRCVGFTGADFMNENPVDGHVTNAMGDDLYAACKVVDGDNQDGSTIRSLAKVLKARGRIDAYAFASSIDEVIAFVTTKGPICWGIGWTDSMFTPDATGLVVPAGPDVGGHAITEFSYDPLTDLHWFLNHWGPWGINGTFCMRGTDLAARLADGGEAMAAVELPA